MGYYTDYRLEVPTTFFESVDPETVRKVEEHLEALEELGVEVNPKAKVRGDLPEGVHILEGIGTAHEEALEIGGYIFYQGDKKTEFYQNNIKFYEWEGVLKRLSAQVPGLFVLTGDGEQGGDHWRAFFQGGKFYRVEPTFPEFDESLLE